MLFSDNKIIVAPMAGITDPVFRMICKEHGADIVMSEMVSAEGMIRAAHATEELIRFSETERPIGIQLFGADPEHMAEAAARIEALVKPDFIDLNSGCPVPKVVKRNGGAALLRDRPRFEKIIRAMRKAISIPLTVKIRSGWNTHEWVDLEFARAAQDCGADALILHPRSRAMGFGGHSFWERIAEVKKVLTIPVIGNGDIHNGADAVKMRTETGCDSVMIGRAAYGNPWVFGQVRAAFDKDESVPVTVADRVRCARTHLERYLSMWGERKAAADMKKHIAWYVKGVASAARMRDQVFRAQTTAELIDALHLFEQAASAAG